MSEDLEDKIEEKKEQIAKKKAQKRNKGTDSPLDPMLVDPIAAQQERFAGTTSDASTRAEGTVASDVDPDPADDPNKPSDAENYAFPPAGDVDIATVDPGSGEGESLVAPTLEDWVVLDGSHDAVPDALDGRRAVILQLIPLQDVYTQEEWDDTSLTVRTRDDYGATLTIPTDAIKTIQRGGVNPART